MRLDVSIKQNAVRDKDAEKHAHDGFHRWKRSDVSRIMIETDSDTSRERIVEFLKTLAAEMSAEVGE